MLILNVTCEEMLNEVNALLSVSRLARSKAELRMSLVHLFPAIVNSAH